MIPYPTYKDPREYTERKDLIDYIEHLKSEHFKLIKAYNDLEELRDQLDTRYHNLKHNILELVGRYI